MDFLVSISSYGFPVILEKGYVIYENGIDTSIIEKVFIKNKWEKNLNCTLPIGTGNKIPKSIALSWMSIVEKKCYNSKIELEIIEDIIGSSSWQSLVIGLLPYGDIAIWIMDIYKSILVNWKPFNILDFKELNQAFSDEMKKAFRFYYNSYNASIDLPIPPRNLFDKFMQQFTYRYFLLFEKWGDRYDEKWHKYGDDDMFPMFEYIEEALYDGTHDKLHDGSLMKYHEAGKPKKLRIQWHIGKSEYSAYFWFEDERIRDVFDKFYGAHPDTKTDFIIRIDAEQRKYELALYRYGLKEPQIVPEDVYQLLVFKNKFEDYRSDNYNQERGAWIW